MIARDTTMTKSSDWLLPYLIALKPLTRTKIFLDLPDRRSFIDNVPGIGEVEVNLGGVTWEMEREYLRSIASKVPSPISAVVSANLEDDLDLLQQGAVNIVSEKFLTLIKNDITDSEFLPMSVQFTPRGQKSIGGGDVVGNYYWLNSWNRVDIVNRSESDLFIMPADGKDAFQPRGEPMFSAWNLLNLRALDPEPAYYGIAGLVGGKRFISPAMHEKMRLSGLKLKYNPVLLDQRDPVKTNSEEYRYRNFLND